MEWYKILDGKAIQIIEALFTKGEMTYSEIRNHVGGSTTTVYRKLEILDKNNIIIEVQEEYFPFRRVFKLYLSKRNQRIAKAIVALKKELK